MSAVSVERSDLQRIVDDLRAIQATIQEILDRDKPPGDPKAVHIREDLHDSNADGTWTDTGTFGYDEGQR